MTENFTFRQEVLDNYDDQVYQIFMDVFDSMPLACIVNNEYLDQSYLAVHGGISPDLQKLEEINKINRFLEIPLDGLFCDLLWADPMKDDQAARGKFLENKERDCSYYFGKKPTKKLLENNMLTSIIRGH